MHLNWQEQGDIGMNEAELKGELTTRLSTMTNAAALVDLNGEQLIAKKMRIVFFQLHR